MLFHPMRWQSEENVGLAEASEWARHFAQLEQDMDTLLAKLFGVPAEMMRKWIIPGRYVSGREMADAGMAELVELDKLHRVAFDEPSTKAKSRSSKGSAATLSVRGYAKSPAARRQR
jgi:hypothetical protein